MNYKLWLRYNGCDYHGWAIQPNLKTVQGTISEIIKKIFKLDKFVINSSGRTDKGVHAYEQIINIKHKDLKIDPSDLMHAINSQLDYDIKINSCEVVDDSFHARFSCKNKTYVYVLNTNKEFDVFNHRIIYQYNKPVDLNKLIQIKNMFIGTRNFLSFSTSEFKTTDCIRTINFIEFNQEADLIKISINADGFLRNMVRMIIATFLAYNENLVTIEEINKCFLEPKKGSIKYKAPACGLYLVKVNYE